MADNLSSRFKRGWNAFLNRDPTMSPATYGSSYRPDRISLSQNVKQSIIAPIYNRIAINVASIPIKHVKTNQNGSYVETIQSGLNNALTLSSNIDQSGRSLIQDLVLSMFDEGCVAVVPIDTTTDPTITGSYDIRSLRIGKIIEWFPYHVRVSVYNEQTGKKENLTMPKNMVAIIENPFYSVMNENNSTLKRLIRKLNELDAIDEQSSSGKLDVIIQLPYIIRSEARREQAEKRRKDIEDQLTGSKYGVAYTDGTEHITQLNRPAENNLMAQVTYLTSMLFSQLGMTENVFNGTANETEMLHYFTTSVEPILDTICTEMRRTFLTKTALSQNQSIMYLRNPFKLVPVSALADVADKFTRNAILTSNEVRPIVGFSPSDDPKADELSNKNLNQNQPQETNTEGGNKNAEKI